jgi:hypothetical protein
MGLMKKHALGSNRNVRNKVSKIHLLRSSKIELVKRSKNPQRPVKNKRQGVDKID